MPWGRQCRDRRGVANHHTCARSGVVYVAAQTETRRPSARKSDGSAILLALRLEAQTNQSRQVDCVTLSTAGKAMDASTRTGDLRQPLMTRDLDAARRAFETGGDGAVEASRLAHNTGPKNGVNGMAVEQHEQSGGRLKGIVFGGLDGILTSFAIISGSVGANLGPVAMLALGISNVLADALSMGVGEYLSSRSYNAVRPRAPHARPLPLCSRALIPPAPPALRHSMCARSASARRGSCRTTRPARLPRWSNSSSHVACRARTPRLSSSAVRARQHARSLPRRRGADARHRPRGCAAASAARR
jgi:hypothetical protein